jgi:hypothetical protein
MEWLALVFTLRPKNRSFFAVFGEHVNVKLMTLCRVCNSIMILIYFRWTTQRICNETKKIKINIFFNLVFHFFSKKFTKNTQNFWSWCPKYIIACINIIRSIFMPYILKTVKFQFVTNIKCLLIFIVHPKIYSNNQEVYDKTIH